MTPSTRITRFSEGGFCAQRLARRNQRNGSIASGKPDFADIGQVAVALCKVDAVAHDKLVGDLETAVIQRRLLGPRRNLVQQRADPDAARIAGFQHLDQMVDRQAGIDDVLDDAV